MEFLVECKFRSGRRTVEVAPGYLDEMFQLIERLTGLDRTIATTILAAGLPIEHPAYRFLAA